MGMEETKKKKFEAKEKQRATMAEKQLKMAARVKELEDQGVAWAQVKALQEFVGAEKKDANKRKKEFAAKHSVAGSAATIAAQLEDLEMEDLPMVKFGDTQMTATGMLGSISYMSVSRAKPLDKLSSVKPLTSIFHPSLFISLLGQFGVHLITMMWATHTAKQYLEEDYKVDLDGTFKPGILNSVVFLVNNVQQVTVFVVNLQGRPFMTGLTENRPLLWSLLATFILTFMFASESVPGLNKYFQLVPFPSIEFRDYILTLLAADVVICFLFDRLMKFLFCPQILKASVAGTTMKDVWSLARTCLVIGTLMHMFIGNSDKWEEMLAEEARLAAEEASGAETGDGILAVVENAITNDEF